MAVAVIVAFWKEDMLYCVACSVLLHVSLQHVDNIMWQCSSAHSSSARKMPYVFVEQSIFGLNNAEVI